MWSYTTCIRRGSWPTAPLPDGGRWGGTGVGIVAQKRPRELTTTDSSLDDTFLCSSYDLGSSGGGCGAKLFDVFEKRWSPYMTGAKRGGAPVS